MFQITPNSRAGTGGSSGLSGGEGHSAGAEHSWDVDLCSARVVASVYCPVLALRICSNSDVLPLCRHESTKIKLF